MFHGLYRIFPQPLTAGKVIDYEIDIQNKKN